ncbi:MAG: 4-hydroxybenzoate--CoA ligase [Rhodospirillaceae bacterium]|nr:4-hydroxybenzoate--CoA ligase [Rhodospirillaceae bacterium]|tara:strand:+ start:2455 stop:3996 length:1542 start_codon:yes stop_codon:yes gene_type:complete
MEDNPSSFSQYNAADDLISRNLKAGRGNKIAFRDRSGVHSYLDIEERTNQFANLLISMNIKQESRLILVMSDSADLVICFLGAIKAGVVPVPLNTRLSSEDYAYIFSDSRADACVISEHLVDIVSKNVPEPARVLVDGSSDAYPTLASVLESADKTRVIASTKPDDVCFWLYTSGTTGSPKGVVHLHSHLAPTADLYAIPILNISEDDVVFSAAKLFFAYGLGNALTFPMAVGASAILLEGPPEPVRINKIFLEEKPTLFFGVPTLFAMLLASDNLPTKDKHDIRLCISAGEPLPSDLLARWQSKFGVDILDGLGTTEMLHIFVSNRPDEITPGSTGRVVPGYQIRLINDNNEICAPGEMGVLEVSGPSSALMYWGQRQKTKDTFRGSWTRTGDNYFISEEGVMTYGGRNDDMLKVGGIYVSPFEVEAALIKHEAVLEAAVVGKNDHDGLVKPKGFIVLNKNFAGSDELASELINFVKTNLAEYKYPRWIEFLDELPKTATGKIQRFKLRTAS